LLVARSAVLSEQSSNFVVLVAPTKVVSTWITRYRSDPSRSTVVFGFVVDGFRSITSPMIALPTAKMADVASQNSVRSSRIMVLFLSGGA
jgi:hypothetical protein